MNNSLIIGTVVLLAIVFLIGSHCTLKEGATGTPTNNPCPQHFPYASEYPKKGSGEWYCYTEKDGGGGVCSYGGTSPTPDGKGEWNSNQPPCPASKSATPSAPSSSIGTPSASSGTVAECKSITNDNAEKCAALASSKNRLAAVKKLELDECVKLGPSWTSAVTGHYEGPACSNPKTGTSCCLGDNCAGLKKCALPGVKSKPDLPPPITGKELVQVCKGAPFPAQKGLSLAQRQTSLLNTNKKLMDLSNKIYACIEKVYAKRINLGTYSTEQQQNMSKQLAQYENVRKELLQHQRDQSSLQAMLTDKKLQTSSTAMHYTLWLILAISGAVIAIRQLSR